MSDVHQCPRCTLRFLLRTELDDHLRREHPADLDDDTVEFDRPVPEPTPTPIADPDEKEHDPAEGQAPSSAATPDGADNDAT